MKIGVLGLQGDVREHLAMLETLDVSAVVVKRPEEIDAVDGLILPGGESTTIGKLLDRFELLDPLIERVRGGLPLLGTCAGLILMARDVVPVLRSGRGRPPVLRSGRGHPAGPEDTLHRLAVMDVVVRRNAYGRQVDSFEVDLAVAGLEEPLRAAFIRAPVIESLAPEVEVLSVWDDRPVLVRQESMMGATFHPEVTGDARVHELFVRSI